MDDLTNKLMLECLKRQFPIKKIRMPSKNNSRRTFQRAIKIGGGRAYRLSNNVERYNAMVELSKILTKVFCVTHEETIPILKEHLHMD